MKKSSNKGLNRVSGGVSFSISDTTTNDGLTKTVTNVYGTKAPLLNMQINALSVGGNATFTSNDVKERSISQNAYVHDVQESSDTNIGW